MDEEEDGLHPLDTPPPQPSQSSKRGTKDKQAKKKILSHASRELARKKLRWSSEEKEELKRLVRKYGKNWDKVAGKMPGRTSVACLQQHAFLEPSAKPKSSRVGWTAEEEERLIKMDETSASLHEIEEAFPRHTITGCISKLEKLRAEKAQRLAERTAVSVQLPPTDEAASSSNANTNKQGVSFSESSAKSVANSNWQSNLKLGEGFQTIVIDSSSSDMDVDSKITSEKRNNDSSSDSSSDDEEYMTSKCEPLLAVPSGKQIKRMDVDSKKTSNVKSSTNSLFRAPSPVNISDSSADDESSSDEEPLQKLQPEKETHFNTSNHSSKSGGTPIPIPSNAFLPAQPPTPRDSSSNNGASTSSSTWRRTGSRDLGTGFKLPRSESFCTRELHLRRRFADAPNEKMEERIKAIANPSSSSGGVGYFATATTQVNRSTGRALN
ncbi:hypothetical protein T439DRAFT_335477 [Meredithblackwellia eburnea MCA 4105]